jgi:hypothetical protein
MEPLHQALIEPIVTWTRASCSKLGGASADANQSQLFTPWRQEKVDQRFVQWVNTAVNSFFPGTAFGANNNQANAASTKKIGAMTQAMTRSLTTGLLVLVHGITALAPVQATMQSPMQQEAILEACGLKPGNRMEPPEQTGHLGLLRQQREDGQLVLRRALLVRMNAENQHMTGLKIMPTISHEVAKDIQRCVFGGEQALSGETCD